VTTTFPVVAPLGTGSTTLVALQLVGVPAVPLNVTVLVPRFAPKFVPAIVTAVPTDPEPGLTLLMLCAGTLRAKSTDTIRSANRDPNRPIYLCAKTCF
jgi:hypothetical protein